ncbi:MAG: transmembrane 220 family protein [Phaeodactylibacter sp.]|nr:transmembrane 220 family protein [Phaeodactylibacter sp.]MCB9276364.1 transmembrane 220 family protein [Lewinellaceae bacterium]
MKIFNLFLALLFALFAAVQYNDPDPWRWIIMYGFVAVVSGFAAFGRYHPYLLYIGLGITAIWMASLLPDFIDWVKIGMPTITGSMKAESPHVEMTREFLGLLLCGAVIGWQWRRSRRAGTH